MEPIIFFEFDRPVDPAAKALRGEELRFTTLPGIPEPDLSNVNAMMEARVKYPLDQLMENYRLKMESIMSQPVMRFVSCVAGLIGSTTEDMMRDTYRPLLQFFRSLAKNAPPHNFVPATIDPETGQPLASQGRRAGNEPAAGAQEKRAPEDLAKAFLTEQTAMQFVAIEELLLSPLLVQNNYFGEELAASNRVCLTRVHEQRRLRFTLQQVYTYVIHSDEWMPRYAELVALYILFCRKQRFQSSTFLQLHQMEINVNNKVDEFRNMSMRDLDELTARLERENERYRQKPVPSPPRFDEPDDELEYGPVIPDEPVESFYGVFLGFLDYLRGFGSVAGKANARPTLEQTLAERARRLDAMPHTRDWRTSLRHTKRVLQALEAQRLSAEEIEKKFLTLMTDYEIAQTAPAQPTFGEPPLHHELLKQRYGGFIV